MPGNSKEPMINHNIETLPWQKVATDLFEWKSASFLVTVDYHSRFFKIDKLPTTSSSAVITKLKAHFARHGIPSQLMSDNGPQFTSREFTDFAKTWGIALTTSSPGYPKSNGLVEKAVQISKNIMTKVTENGEDPFLGIIEYRNTPVDGFASPAQLLMSRQLRSILPCTSQHLKKKVIPTTQFTRRRTEMQKRQKLYHDKSARSLKQLTPGDAVYVQKTPNRPWSQAVVLSHAGKPRSYRVRTNEGSMLRRNHKHLTARPHQSQQGLSRVSETGDEAAPPITETAIE